MRDLDRFQDKYRDMFRPTEESFFPEYECLSCKQMFYKGVSIDGDKLCDQCHRSHEHFNYFRKQGVSDRDIWENEKYTKRL